ncbi:MAG: hydroxyethylthiazole kinase [Pseudomonadota bacterium]
MTITPESIWADVTAIRHKAPLIHNITNYVVMNTTANALLALGASPVMAHALPEVEQMVGYAGALVINIGTLSDAWITAMTAAARRAGEIHVPVILDPVGSGATQYRTRTARNLAEEFRPAIIRGNGSEIMSLCRLDVRTKGVDSANSSDAALEAASALNRETGSIVCITGQTDYIVGGPVTHAVYNGHPMMPRVTGLGCTASALCGAFAAVNKNFDMAAAHAMAVMGIAGEMAARTARGPGSLQTAFIDSLYLMTEADIRELFRTGGAAA